MTDDTDAHARIDKHEAVCAERYLHIHDAIVETKRDVRALYSRFWVAACAIIALLVSVLIAVLQQ